MRLIFTSSEHGRHHPTQISSQARSVFRRRRGRETERVRHTATLAVEQAGVIMDETCLAKHGYSYSASSSMRAVHACDYYSLTPSSPPLHSSAPLRPLPKLLSSRPSPTPFPSTSQTWCCAMR